MTGDPLTRLRDDIARAAHNGREPCAACGLWPDLARSTNQADAIVAMLTDRYPGMVAALRAEHAEVAESRARIRGMVADVARGEGGHVLQRKPPGSGGGHTPGVGWMCTGCGWRFSYDVPETRAHAVWIEDRRHGGEESP